MSYCRFSSLNMMCDVYVYQGCGGGWTTHVASARPVIPPIPSLLDGQFMTRVHRWTGANWNSGTRNFEYPSRWRKHVANVWFRFAAWWQTYIHGGSIKLIPMRSIGLPMDGETFNDATAEACASLLEALRALGYRVPQYAIDALRDEA
jgi:hypothetical protein